MKKQLRELTEQELSQLQGMRNMTLEERIKAQGNGLANIPEEEQKRKQIEAASGIQNHKWPWDEK